MEKDKLTALAEKYLNGMATEEEQKLLHEWYDDWQDAVVYIHNGASEEETGQRLLTGLRSVISSRDRRADQWTRRKIWRRIAAAAVVIGLIGTSAYLLLQRAHSHAGQVAVVQPPAIRQDAIPGGNKAVLTLANGSSIVLDSAANGTLAQQGNVKVIKLSNGQLVYQPAGASEGRVDYNTMTTPRGGQYRLVLPDGTNVWLNAASSITYPTAFTGAERKVSITGEAYFEVTKDSKKPFLVTSGDAVVQVLGTHFNINAYGDDHVIRTTLLEGSVKVGRGDGGVIIQPGEQAGIPRGGGIDVSKVDVGEVIAWKNGLFQFNNDNIEHIMHQLARWYDLEVVYEGRVPTDRFNGEVPRSVNVSVILQILEASGTKFRIEGKKIIVLP